MNPPESPVTINQEKNLVEINGRDFMNWTSTEWRLWRKYSEDLMKYADYVSQKLVVLAQMELSKS